MSKFERFMKANKGTKLNEFHAVTKSLCDEEGNPLEWEFRHITSKENNRLRNEATKDIPVPGKANMYRQKVDTDKYIASLLVASIVYPDLYDAELQDSYGVKKPDDLLFAMVDDPGEYMELISYIQTLQGFDTTFEDEVEEAKN